MYTCTAVSGYDSSATQHNTNIISHIPRVKFMNNGLKTDDSKQSAGEGYDTAQKQHHNGQQRLCSNQNVNVVPLTLPQLFFGLHNPWLILGRDFLRLRLRLWLLGILHCGLTCTYTCEVSITWAHFENTCNWVQFRLPNVYTQPATCTADHLHSDWLVTFAMAGNVWKN